MDLRRTWLEPVCRAGTDRPIRTLVPGRLLMGLALLVAGCLLPPELSGLGVQEHLSDLQVAEPCAEALSDILREARGLAEVGELESAAALLARALLRCPDDPGLLADLAGLRILQGDLVEAEVLATHLVGIVPRWSHAWELLALSRYLQDNAHGALHAWNQVDRPRVRSANVQLLDHDGARERNADPYPGRLAGVIEHRALTAGTLVRGERRLGALPAADRARLGYRMVPGGEATVEGTVVLGATNPFSRPALWWAHGFRLLGRRIHLVSADPLGRLERWELSGTMEGTLHGAGLTLAHPTPGGDGVWSWGLHHETGRYGSGRSGDAVRETSTRLAWSHTDWVSATMRGALRSRIEYRPERGTFVGAGAGATLLPPTAWGSLGAEGTGWIRIREAGPDADGPGSVSRFGRTELRGVLHAIRSPLRTDDPDGEGMPTGSGRSGMGLDLRGSIHWASEGIPPDLSPRMGAGGNTSLLMRAHSDLDDQGVIQTGFPGTAWAHGGIEAHRPMGSVGPVGLGVAMFAEGVRVLSPERSLATATDRRGAVHVGGGVRARIPWVDGWLRADWGIDPSDGTSAFSAAWFREHRLNRLWE